MNFLSVNNIFTLSLKYVKMPCNRMQIKIFCFIVIAVLVLSKFSDLESLCVSFLGYCFWNQKKHS